jgi:hypothetical protein
MKQVLEAQLALVVQDEPSHSPELPLLPQAAQLPLMQDFETQSLSAEQVLPPQREEPLVESQVMQSPL